MTNSTELNCRECARKWGRVLNLQSADRRPLVFQSQPLFLVNKPPLTFHWRSFASRIFHHIKGLVGISYKATPPPSKRHESVLGEDWNFFRPFFASGHWPAPRSKKTNEPELSTLGPRPVCRSRSRSRTTHTGHGPGHGLVWLEAACPARETRMTGQRSRKKKRPHMAVTAWCSHSVCTRFSGDPGQLPSGRRLYHGGESSPFHWSKAGKASLGGNSGPARFAVRDDDRIRDKLGPRLVQWGFP